ncbi:MAG: phytanoyl-CoA dioxygenase family protein [Chitinophagales bacterium]
MEDFICKNNSLFKDNKLNEEIDENGYSVIPFLSNEEIKILTEYYNTNYTKETGIQFSTFIDEFEAKLRTNKIINEITERAVKEYFTNYKIFMSGFIVKNNDKKSELVIHQDMSLVDESKFNPINIWIPLCNINNKNGALQLLKGSHKIFYTYRNANISNMYSKNYNLIKEYLTPIHIKAGYAIVFNSSIVHYSGNNESDENRIAIKIFMSNKDAVITIPYYDKEKNKIELFEQDDDFLFKFQQFNGPNKYERPLIGKSIGYRQYDFPELTPELLEKKYGKLQNSSFIRKIISKIT